MARGPGRPGQGSIERQVIVLDLDPVGRACSARERNVADGTPSILAGGCDSVAAPGGVIQSCLESGEARGSRFESSAGRPADGRATSSGANR